MGEYWSTHDLAEAADLTPQRIRQLLAAGSIEGFKVGRDWVIPKDAALRWLRSRDIDVSNDD